MLSFSDIWFHNNQRPKSYIWKNYFQQLEMESLGKQSQKILNSKKLDKLFLEDMVQQHNIIFSTITSRNSKYLCRYNFKAKIKIVSLFSKQ